MVVEDVLDALASLSRAVLARIADPVVIGLTGSSGKTSTKDLLAQVLPGLGPTTATLARAARVPRRGDEDWYECAELIAEAIPLVYAAARVWTAAGPAR